MFIATLPLTSRIRLLLLARRKALLFAFGITLSLVAVDAVFGQTDSQPGDLSGPVGTWYLSTNGFRLTTTIIESAPNQYQGNMVQEGGGGSSELDNIHWNPITRTLEFRRVIPGTAQWYRGTVAEGIFVGRFARSNLSASQPGYDCGCYTSHVTAWNSSYIDQDRTPRVYELLINNNYRARLRIDSSVDSASGYRGQLKIYSTVSGGAVGEEPEFDVDVTNWNGKDLTFVRHTGGVDQIYTGTVSGRHISGTFATTGSPALSTWRGERAEVLTYGLSGKSYQGRVAWQQRVRKQLVHLMMAGNPAPLATSVTTLRANVASSSTEPRPTHRDDGFLNLPQSYNLSELRFQYTLPNPYGGNSITRFSHGYLAVPVPAPPPGVKLPAVIAVNGHAGSAWKVMNATDELYWYGDSLARRGFVVLALDISHRPLADRRGLYSDILTGDDSDHGNNTHAAVKAEGYDSDWEEEGERAWDVMRGADYLTSLPFVDASRLVVTGHSLGGEVSMIAGALDERFSITIPSGYSPDMGVMLYNGNHPCWRWLNADIREYVDLSDYYGLVAPRPLLIQTGKVDNGFSQVAPWFSASKQLARRTRFAYGNDNANFIHYLHYDGHHYHVGDSNPNSPIGFEQFIRVPTVTRPTLSDPLNWQKNGDTRSTGWTLFDYISCFLNGRDCAR